MGNADRSEAAGRPSGRWRLAAAGVVLAAAGLYLVRLGDRAVVSEESRWAEAAREMRQTGDFLRPTVNGRLYFDKPAGSYWPIVAASHLTGGVDETAARLPSALAGVAGVWVVMLLGRRLSGDRAGVCAGVVLATGFGFAFYARRATADVETTTGVLIAVWVYTRHEGRPPGPWVVALWVWMAAVSLAKGLLGFALPLAVFAVHGAWEGGRREGPFLPRMVAANRWLFTRWTLLGVPLAAAAYLLPFLLAADGEGAGLAMVWRENVRRFAAPHNHLGPVYLYVGVVFVLAAPWGAFLPAALLPPRGGTAGGDRLARAYFWAVFLFFTAAASRRSYYLLPVLPAVALLVGRLLAAGADELTRAARALRGAGWIAFGATAVASGALLLPPAWVLPAPYDQLPALPGRGWLAAVWAGGIAAVIAAAGRPGWRPALAAAWAFAAFAYGFWAAYAGADDFRPRREFLAAVRAATAPAPDRLALFHAGDVVFDLGRTSPEYPDGAGLAAAAGRGEVRWVVVPRKALPAVGFAARVVAEEAAFPWEPPDRLGNKLVLVEAAP